MHRYDTVEAVSMQMNIDEEEMDSDEYCGNRIQAAEHFGIEFDAKPHLGPRPVLCSRDFPGHMRQPERPV